MELSPIEDKPKGVNASNSTTTITGSYNPNNETEESE